MSEQYSSGWANDPVRGAGARRRYNRLRQDQARIRQAKVATLLLEFGWQRGSGVYLARELGVSEATISRDIHAIFALPNRPTLCQFCGGVQPSEVGIEGDDESHLRPTPKAEVNT